MRKMIICNIPMKANVDLAVYESDDKSLPMPDRSISYPINGFLEMTLSSEDEVKLIFLAKTDAYSHATQNVQNFLREFQVMNERIGARVEHVVIESASEETQDVHEALLDRLVDALEDGTHIQADITYGPKDMVPVLFTALNFAEKFLDCSVDNIVYGKANFENGRVVNTKICDMVPLYSLGAVTNIIKSNGSARAREMLKNLLSI